MSRSLDKLPPSPRLRTGRRDDNKFCGCHCAVGFCHCELWRLPAGRQEAIYSTQIAASSRTRNDKI
ncbi:MAG: hypothetical protein ABIJ72_01200 [bacterium]